MDTKQIEYIIKIADEGSITRAAEKLFITQSALSQQLQKPDTDLHAVCGADANDDLLHVRTQAPFFPAGTAARPCT